VSEDVVLSLGRSDRQDQSGGPPVAGDHDGGSLLFDRPKDFRGAVLQVPDSNGHCAYKYGYNSRGVSNDQIVCDGDPRAERDPVLRLGPMNREQCPHSVDI